MAEIRFCSSLHCVQNLISSIPKLKENIVKGMNEPLEECVREEEVEW